LPLVLLTWVTDHATSTPGVTAVVRKPVRAAQIRRRLATVTGIRRRTLAATSGGAAAVKSNGHRVLVAEDQFVNQQVASLSLRKLGYEIDVVPDGARAVAAWRTGRYDAILMDCHMPEMDGFEATRAIRREEKAGTRIPIFALSASALPDEREACRVAGMDGFLAKPLDLDVLAATLGRAIPSKPRIATSAVASRSPRDTQGSARAAAAAVVVPAETSGDGEKPVWNRTLIDELRSLQPEGEPDPVPDLLRGFLLESVKGLEKLEESARNGDAPATRAAAHRLKGGALNLGAERLAAACATVEKAARRGESVQPGALVRCVVEFERFREAAAECLASS
jgi:CheY-like chemotaxis protein/HPt (histidine-containing phosphotransfer) domain-containing protein